MTIQTQLLAASYNEKLNLRVCVYAIPVPARQPVSEAIALAAHRPDENAGTAAVDLEQPRYTPDRSGSGLFWAKTDTEFEPQDTQSKHPSEELIEEYWFRRLPTTRARALERHVRRCKKCAQRLKAEIDLIRILRPALRD